jgi:hypothetical protein
MTLRRPLVGILIAIAVVLAMSSISEAARVRSGEPYRVGPPWTDSVAYHYDVRSIPPPVEVSNLASTLTVHPRPAQGTRRNAGQQRSLVDSVAADTAAESGLSEAFHYTSAESAQSILENGARPGLYATPNGGLSPLQAQLRGGWGRALRGALTVDRRE